MSIAELVACCGLKEVFIWIASEENTLFYLKSQFESQVKMDKWGQRLKFHEQIESLERIQVNQKQILTSDQEIFKKNFSHV